eukprot:CAMPEP_0182472342 /NCGR_PEP_ID=MMETSP1319-20130603/22008_1 /TAXON_ID=172717 /ORGANISM="Bolidomonas pacifica, Strain RCC208" /LENGTH=384 /DNA_ID=CAMNT_0024673009 /DNA_START=64 /DNA_END=1215 /DNA_ORIENTATION=-
MPRPHLPIHTTAALILGLTSSAMAARPPYAGFNKSSTACEKSLDCPPSWNCYTEDGMEVAPPLSPGPGQCECYVTFGSSGPDCQDRALTNALWFSVTSMILFLTLCYLLGSLNIIFIKLISAKAFSMKKASNVAFIYLYAAIFGIALYQIAAFMASTNTGSYALWVDVVRPLGVALALVFFLMCGFQITVVWMKLALSTQKKGGETENKIHRIILCARCIQCLVILVVASSIATGVIAIMFFFSVVMSVVLGVFFHFGGNMLGGILMPKPDATIEPSVWEKRAEPAKKVLRTAGILRFSAPGFGLLILVSSILGLTNADASKSLTGAIVYQLNMVNATSSFYVVKDYLSYGVRKVLKSGKVASFGAGTTTKTTGVTAVTAVTSA